ncbi:MAG TPA: DUF885 family protein, partial [Longimicrobiales bacterium]|nr:DUF885 family protein [Longimicrobiales bacterium]
MVTTAPAFDAWLDDFFRSYHAHRPVNASFIGEHEHDPRLPDFGESAVGDVVADMDDLLARLATLPREELTSAQALDRRMAEGFLRIQRWEYASQHHHRGNPSLYTGEAVFGVFSLFLTPYAPVGERVEAARARLAAIPRLLEQGRANVAAAHPEWTQRALRECRGALAFLEDGVDLLAAEQGFEAAALRREADAAAGAFSDFRSHLEGTLLSRPRHGVACGDGALDLHLRWGHFLDRDADAVAAYAQERMSEARAWLAEHAADFGAASPAQALAGLADLHPTRGGYYLRYQETWDHVRALARREDLVTWPEAPLRYAPRPRWTREAAPDLYFLFYRSPAAVARPPVHDYLVTPLDDDLGDADAEALLRANNDSVIKLNHVVHHGGIGHHVQNGHAFRSASRIGRVAAVDCASRIALFCGGTMAEGWACYATDLVAEFGGLTPLERYAEVHARVRMAARTVVDVRLHQGRITLDEAAEYYVRTTGMSAAAARGEAVKNSMFPGAAVMYLMGTDAIHGLRSDVAKRVGSGFSLRRFHDDFLAYGSVPVTLVADDML